MLVSEYSILCEDEAGIKVSETSYCASKESMQQLAICIEFQLLCYCQHTFYNGNQRKYFRLSISFINHNFLQVTLNPKLFI
jgi:hypothetical protein